MQLRTVVEWWRWTSLVLARRHWDNVIRYRTSLTIYGDKDMYTGPSDEQYNFVYQLALRIRAVEFGGQPI